MEGSSHAFPGIRTTGPGGPGCGCRGAGPGLGPVQLYRSWSSPADVRCQGRFRSR